MPGNLADLLENADAAAPDQRIKWRDPIAVHGTNAVAAMAEWLKDGKNTGFAIRTLERIAEADDPMVAAYAVRAMRRLRPKVSESDKGLIKAALKRLGEPDKAKTPKPDPRLYERLIGAARRHATGPQPQADRYRGHFCGSSSFGGAFHDATWMSGSAQLGFCPDAGANFGHGLTARSWPYG